MSIWMKTATVFYADFTAADVHKGSLIYWASTPASVINECKTRGKQEFTQVADRNRSTLSKRASRQLPSILSHAHFHNSIRRTVVTFKNVQATEGWNLPDLVNLIVYRLQVDFGLKLGTFQSGPEWKKAISYLFL